MALTKMLDAPILLLLAVVVAVAFGSSALVRVMRLLLRQRPRGEASEGTAASLPLAITAPPPRARDVGAPLHSLVLPAPAWHGADAAPAVSVSLGETARPATGAPSATVLSAVLEHSLAASAIVDARGRWLHANPALLAMLACADAGELAQLTPRSLAIDPSAVLAALLELESRNEANLELELRGLDGRRFRCRVAIRRREEGAEAVFLVSALDLDALRESLLEVAAAPDDPARGMVRAPAAPSVATEPYAAERHDAAADSTLGVATPPGRALDGGTAVAGMTAHADTSTDDAAAFLERRLPALATSVRDALERGDIGAAIHVVDEVAHEALARGAEVCAGDLDRIRVDLENGRLEAPEEIELLLVTVLPALRAARAARARATSPRVAA